MIEFLEKWSNQIVGMLSVAGTIITTVIVNRFNRSNESLVTSRELFEKCYSPIYFLVEQDLYSESITPEKVVGFANQIDKILIESQPYFSPFIKVINEKLYLANHANVDQIWQFFSKEFMHEFSHRSNDIGLLEKKRKYNTPIVPPPKNDEIVRTSKSIIIPTGDRLFILILSILLILIASILAYMFSLSKQ